MNGLFKRSALTLAVAACFGTGAAMAAEVDTKGGIKVKSDDGQFVGELKGRMHLDAYAFEDDGSIKNEGGTDFRRLRLTGESTLYGVYKGKIEIDFRTNRNAGDASSVVVRDAYLTRTGLGPGDLTVGQLKVPMGLEELTSSNYITFIERSLPVSAVAPTHRRGIAYSGTRENLGYAVMAYGEGVRDNATNVSEGVGLGGRITYTPLKDKTQVLHLGLSAANEFDVERFQDVRTRYEANLADEVTIVDVPNAPGLPAGSTGLVDVDSIKRYGVEAAYVSGPLSLQAEYLQAKVESALAGDPEFGGYYVMASYFLTGESRPYRASNGTFDRIKPNSKSGAWEVAARLSNLDGESDTLAKREIENVTLGVNYYLNPQMRIMANLIKSDVDAGASQGDPKTLAFRVQYDF
jgi:phosphate-selective porin OprO/OprP